jgi:hypothetical protein
VAETDAPVFVPWKVRKLGSRDVLDALPDPRAAAKVTAALRKVVAAEGPIPVDRLVRLVAQGFGLTRVLDARKAAILRHLPSELRTDEVEPVIWPPDKAPEDWTGYRRTPNRLQRPAKEVPLREIANAMADVARGAAGISSDELRAEMKTIFGWTRLGSEIAERLDAAFELGLRTGRLQVVDGIVTSG